MSWSARTSNMAVCFTDLQSAPFTLKSGESHVTSNNCMTKLDALNKYELEPAYMSEFSNNWLVPKYSFVASGGTLPPSGITCGTEYNPLSNILVYTQEVNVGTVDGLIIIDYSMFELSNGAVIEVQYEGGAWTTIGSVLPGPTSASSSGIYYFFYNTSDTILVRVTKYV